MLGKREDAAAMLDRALSDASPDDLIMPFVENYRYLGELLDDMCSAAPAALAGDGVTGGKTPIGGITSGGITGCDTQTASVPAGDAADGDHPADHAPAGGSDDISADRSSISGASDDTADSLFISRIRHSGRSYQQHIRRLTEQAAYPAALSVLTDREREIAFLTAAHLSNREIAGKLFLSEGTVKQYMNQIYSKLMIEGDPRTRRKQLIETVNSRT